MKNLIAVLPNKNASLPKPKLKAIAVLLKLLRTLEEMKRSVNALTTRWGRFVEELVEPAVVRLFQERGIDVKEKHPRASVKRQGVAMEIDILVVDTTDVVLGTCEEIRYQKL